MNNFVRRPLNIYMYIYKWSLVQVSTMCVCKCVNLVATVCLLKYIEYTFAFMLCRWQPTWPFHVHTACLLALIYILNIYIYTFSYINSIFRRQAHKLNTMSSSPHTPNYSIASLYDTCINEHLHITERNRMGWRIGKVGGGARRGGGRRRYQTDGERWESRPVGLSNV